MQITLRCLNNRHCRKGFSLVEAAIVLGVVGLVIGGIWLAASAVQQNMRINRTVSGIAIIAQNYKNLFPGAMRTTVLGLTTLDAYRMGLFDGADGFVFDVASNTLSTPHGKKSGGDQIIQTYSDGRIRVYFPGDTNTVSTADCIRITNGISKLGNIVLINIGMLMINYFPYIPTAGECATRAVAFTFFFT